jgi:hypothetical protein
MEINLVFIIQGCDISVFGCDDEIFDEIIASSKNDTSPAGVGDAISEVLEKYGDKIIKGETNISCYKCNEHFNDWKWNGMKVNRIISGVGV